jgi:dTMP kinase
MKIKKRDKFIVVAGIDGSGKATQAGILAEKLKEKGYEVETADFPQHGTKSAALVEEYLNGKFGSAEEVGPYRASIFYACDRYAASFKIRKWLEEGKIVVSNRYVSANIGHQTGKIKDKEERKKFLKWLDNLEYGIFAIPRPDILVFLHVPPEVSQSLVDRKGYRDYVGGEKRDLHEGDIEHLKNATEVYLSYAEEHGWLKIDCAPEGTLESLRKPEDIAEEVWEKVKSLL